MITLLVIPGNGIGNGIITHKIYSFDISSDDASRSTLVVKSDTYFDSLWDLFSWNLDLINWSRRKLFSEDRT